MATRQDHFNEFIRGCELLVKAILHNDPGVNPLEPYINILPNTLIEDLHGSRETIQDIIMHMHAMMNPDLVGPIIQRGWPFGAVGIYATRLTEPHHLMIINLFHQMEIAFQRREADTFGFMYTILALTEEASASEDLENILRDEVNKQVLAWKLEIESQVQQLDLQVKNFLSLSHNLVMQGVNGLTRMTMDRLGNLQYLRYPSMRDPSLIEGGCFNAFKDDPIPGNFRLWMQHLAGKALGGDTLRCGTDGCGFATQLRKAFEANHTQPQLVVCCSRHQYELENTPEVQVELTLMKRLEEEGQFFTVFANVVKNGRILY